MADRDWRTKIRESSFGSIVVVLLTTVVVLAGVYLVNKDDAGGGVSLSASQSQGEFSEIEVSAEMSDPPEVGTPTPGFRAMDMDRNPVDLENIDRPTWLVFNATWCSACRAEVPDIKAVNAERGDEFELVSVWVNESRDTVADFVERLDLNYTHVIDSSMEIAGTYRTMGVPSHYFIDSDGILQDIYVGALSEAQINERLDKITN